VSAVKRLRVIGGVYMNKKDLVELVAEGAELNKAKAEAALNALLEGIKGALKKEEKVTLVGFGTFSVSRRAARKGRNPQTGETIDIAASKAPKFSASKRL
jgi:DNA-binding protein HU-beta